MKRTTWVAAGVAVLVAAAVTSGVVGASGSKEATAAAQEPPAATETVQRGDLSSMITLNGTLTYRARADGSPYAAINQARGIYTRLPEEGDTVDCGDVFYRVDDHPVLLLCGTVPAYRGLRRGDRGQDVRQLNRNLRALGYSSIRALQRAKGFAATGTLDLGDVVFLPGSARFAKVTGKLGESARPGALLAQATSDTLEVQASLEPTQRSVVKPGDRARITLPDNTVAMGTVDRLGTVARTDDAGSATIPASISLDEPNRARGLDAAPVQVTIATKGVDGVLSVPVLALVGKSGGGFAVEVVRGGARRELVAVELGLFDTAGGRVQVEGDLSAGDQVVVPSP